MIRISDNQEMEGMTLVWDKYRTLELIGLKKNLFVSNSFELDKEPSEYVSNIMRNAKDTEIIKLRGKLLFNTKDLEYAIIEELSKPGASLEGFRNTLKLKEQGYEEATPLPPTSPTPPIGEPPAPKATEETEETEVHDEFEWDPNIFQGKKNVVDILKVPIPPDEPEPEPEPEPPTPTELPTTQVLKNIEEKVDRVDSNLTSLILSTNSLPKKEDIEHIVEPEVNNGDLLTTLETILEGGSGLTHILKDMEKSLLKKIDEKMDYSPSPSIYFSQSISPDERKAIDDYRKPQPLINYLRSDRVTDSLEGAPSVNGLELIDGVSEILTQSTEGFFEFLSKHFPYVFTEYQNGVLNKLNEGRRNEHEQ
mgnify:FL=1